MKTVIVVAFVCCLAVAFAEVGDKCTSNEDCDESSECCVRIHDFKAATCKSLREKEEFCFPNHDWNLKDGKYRFMCPCKEGLECKAAEVKEEDGVTTYVNAKCQ